MDSSRSLGLFARVGGWCAGVALGTAMLAVTFADGTPVPTTIPDFTLSGTQPNTLDHPIVDAQSCATCHGLYDEAHEPWTNWAASMMGQSARDPLFHACLTIANQDAAFSGDLCLRCHTPGGWLGGRSTPTDGSALAGADFQGVSCNFCHRMVDPNYQAGVSPAVDSSIINDLTAPGVGLPAVPPNPHSGNFVMDPLDRRRGPFDMGPDFFYHEWLQSPFHQDSAMCATCHDVSNPVYTRQPDGSYALNALNTPHPTQDKHDMFPVERTYSEWLMSDFATAPIDMGGRFGGNKLEVSSCQDCHMPDVTAQGCRFEPERPDMPLHSFNGGNTWVLAAIRNLYPDSETHLTESSVDQSIERAKEMLRNASDMELTELGSELNVRIVNQSGHKLPTGYPEGRRMWLNIRFFDASDAMIAEHGAYDESEADLTTSDTKVYEGKLGLDAAAAAATGKPEGESFHFVLNNTWMKDNRIPPRGFTNANFEAIQAAPVGATYADGQYWDDTLYSIPSGAVRAEARLYYQTASKEYIEFLRDENTTNTTGQVLYDQWVLLGKSEPVEMDFVEISFGGCPADLFPPAAPDGVLNFFDISQYIAYYNAQDPRADVFPDAQGDGVFNFFDISAFIGSYNAGCP
ncbi:MAG: GC-type dockerin domain-anchored protein [Planctomycetota bacterium]